MVLKEVPSLVEIMVSIAAANILLLIFIISK